MFNQSGRFTTFSHPYATRANIRLCVVHFHPPQQWSTKNRSLLGSRDAITILYLEHSLAEFHLLTTLSRIKVVRLLVMPWSPVSTSVREFKIWQSVRWKDLDRTRRALDHAIGRLRVKWGPILEDIILMPRFGNLLSGAPLNIRSWSCTRVLAIDYREARWLPRRLSSILSAASFCLTAAASTTSASCLWCTFSQTRLYGGRKRMSSFSPSSASPSTRSSAKLAWIEPICDCLRSCYSLSWLCCRASVFVRQICLSQAKASDYVHLFYLLSNSWSCHHPVWTEQWDEPESVNSAYPLKNKLGGWERAVSPAAAIRHPAFKVPLLEVLLLLSRSRDWELFSSFLPFGFSSMLNGLPRI